MANATARRAANRLLQAGAFVRGGDAEEAAAEVASLAAVLGALRTAWDGETGDTDTGGDVGEDVGDRAVHNLDLVAFKLERQLSEVRRCKLISSDPWIESRMVSTC